MFRALEGRSEFAESIPCPTTPTILPQLRSHSAHGLAGIHHVLLDSLEQDATVADPTSQEAPSVAISRAFETLDAGESLFPIPEVEAMQRVLATAHHAQQWELERPRLEQHDAARL